MPTSCRLPDGFDPRRSRECRAAPAASGETARAGCPTGRRRRTVPRRGSPPGRPSGTRRRAPRAGPRAGRALRASRREAPDAPSSQVRTRRRRRRGARCAPTPNHTPPARGEQRRLLELVEPEQGAVEPPRVVLAAGGAATWTWSSPTIAPFIARALGAPRDPGPEKRTRFSRWVPCRTPVNTVLRTRAPFV